MALGIPYNYLYRVLRPGEDPAVGIIAKSPSSTLSVSDHVACGAYSTKYISTCATDTSARRFANLGIAHRDQSVPKKIATIDVDKLKCSNPLVRFIDLTDSTTRSIYIPDNSTAIRWAINWDEVLIDGNIPSSCISHVEEIPLNY